MTEFFTSSSLEGRDKLFSVLQQASSEVALILGYDPLVVWSQSNAQEKPAQDKVWFTIANIVTSDRQTAMGKPRKMRVQGGLLVTAFFPKKPETQYKKATECIDCIKRNYREQNVLRGLTIQDLSVQDIAPQNQWNKMQLRLDYQYYYLAN